MRVLAQKAPLEDVQIVTDTRAPTKSSRLQTLTQLAFTELSMLRHRGAFSAVAQAFSACCLRAHRDNEDGMIERFYEVRRIANHKSAYRKLTSARN